MKLALIFLLSTLLVGTQSFAAPIPLEKPTQQDPTQAQTNNFNTFSTPTAPTQMPGLMYSNQGMNPTMGMYPRLLKRDDISNQPSTASSDQNPNLEKRLVPLLLAGAAVGAAGFAIHEDEKRQNRKWDNELKHDAARTSTMAGAALSGNIGGLLGAALGPQAAAQLGGMGGMGGYGGMPMGYGGMPMGGMPMGYGGMPMGGMPMGYGGMPMGGMPMGYGGMY